VPVEEPRHHRREPELPEAHRRVHAEEALRFDVHAADGQLGLLQLPDDSYAALVEPAADLGERESPGGAM
jgi:hypothetical protein